MEWIEVGAEGEGRREVWRRWGGRREKNKEMGRERKEGEREDRREGGKGEERMKE